MSGITFEQFVELHAVQKIYNRIVPEHRDWCVERLYKSYKAFLNRQGLNERKKYFLDQIKKIDFNGREFQIYYKSGDWYNYPLSGGWY